MNIGFKYDHLPFQMSDNLGVSDVRLYGNGYETNVDDAGYGPSDVYHNLASMCDTLVYALCSCDINLDRYSFRALLTECVGLDYISSLLTRETGIPAPKSQLLRYYDGYETINLRHAQCLKLHVAKLCRINIDNGDDINTELLISRMDRPAPPTLDLGYNSMSNTWVWLNEPQPSAACKVINK